MKLWERLEGDTLQVGMSGDFEARDCGCLQSFWKLRAQAQSRLRVDMRDVEADDPMAISVLTRLLEESVRRGTDIVLYAPPQLIAHNLYKLRFLAPEGPIRIEAPRVEEPYGE